MTVPTTPRTSASLVEPLSPATSSGKLSESVVTTYSDSELMGQRLHLYHPAFLPPFTGPPLSRVWRTMARSRLALRRTHPNRGERTWKIVATIPQRNCGRFSRPSVDSQRERNRADKRQVPVFKELKQSKREDRAESKDNTMHSDTLMRSTFSITSQILPFLL
jgi:hypothetical protein